MQIWFHLHFLLVLNSFTEFLIEPKSEHLLRWRQIMILSNWCTICFPRTREPKGHAVTRKAKDFCWKVHVYVLLILKIAKAGENIHFICGRRSRCLKALTLVRGK